MGQVVNPASISPELVALITQTALAVVAVERAKDSPSALSPASQSLSTPSVCWFYWGGGGGVARDFTTIHDVLGFVFGTVFLR